MEVTVIDQESERITAAELDAICDERWRQEQLKKEGRFTYTLADAGIDDYARLACIQEEVGEIARNLLARDGIVTDGETSLTALHKELCQVAALSVAWMEYITTLMDAGQV
jgi:hypothetical protein